MLTRVLRFPLTLLLLEASALIALAGVYTQGAAAAGIIDQGPLQFAGVLLLAASIAGLWKLLRSKLEGDQDREFIFRRAGGELAAGLGIGFVLFSVVAAITALLGGFEVLGWRGLGLERGAGKKRRVVADAVGRGVQRGV